MLTERFKEYFIRRQQTSRQQRLAADDLQRIDWMFTTLAEGDPLACPSRYWEELNRMNVEQLKENGYENFKRTITLNYFTWTRLTPWDSQITFLRRQLPAATVLRCFTKALTARRHDYFNSLSLVQSFSYNFLTLLQWEYLFSLSLPFDVAALSEPDEGNPAMVMPRAGMSVSQDLANSLLEFDSLYGAFRTSERQTVLELGAGYGRNAYVILKLVPAVKYVIVDIPPALWVAERYLSRVFPEKRIFTARRFSCFEDVADEFARADIVFLLSTQLALLPSQSIDVIVNISSLHEMRRDQINYYCERFDALLKHGGHFYFKQWREARVLFEGLTLVESDYPIPASWRRVFSRTARVQTRFFEAMYQKA